MNKPFKYFWLTKEMGLKWCLFRVLYSAKICFGYLEMKCRQTGWGEICDTEIRLIGRWRLPVMRERLSSCSNNLLSDCLLKRAKEIVEGKISLYESISAEIGTDPDLHWDPISKHRYDKSVHWGG